MSRINKFRGYDKVNKRMFEVYGLGVDWCTENTLDGVNVGQNYWDGDEFKNNIEIMMESDFEISSYSDEWESGNTKFIYDGDIVKLHRFTQELGESLGVIEGEIEYIGVITFEAYGWYFESDNEDRSGYLLHFYGIHDETYTRIGNIYETPELLPIKIT